jgi:hypothetical protein
LSQFWPYFCPVVGPQISARDGATSGAFDRGAMFWRNAAPGTPIRDGTLHNANSLGQLPYTASRGNSTINFIHAAILITFVIEAQHLCD